MYGRSAREAAPTKTITNTERGLQDYLEQRGGVESLTPRAREMLYANTKRNLPVMEPCEYERAIKRIARALQL